MQVKQVFFFIAIFLSYFVMAQPGLKGGLNYSNITNTKQVNSSSRAGFHIGGFLSAGNKGIISSRTELIFSRQGYNFETSTNTGNATLDYIILPQLVGINITKFVQLQAGFQFAYLLSAKTDSNRVSSVPGPLMKLNDIYNRFDYGFAAGIEIHPVQGLIIGARANFSLGKLYKEPQPGQVPSVIPDINAKNNVIQVFAGWRFGKKKTA